MVDLAGGQILFPSSPWPCPRSGGVVTLQGQGFHGDRPWQSWQGGQQCGGLLQGWDLVVMTM